MLTIFSDSMVALAYTKDLKYHDRTKLINIHFHYISYIIVWREMALRHISTSKMMIDLVTKVNNKVVFQTHLRSLGPRFEISQFISDISSIFRELTHVDMIISTEILNGIFFDYFLKISLIYPYLKIFISTMGNCWGKYALNYISEQKCIY